MDDKDLDSEGEEKVVTEIQDDDISVTSSLTANTGHDFDDRESEEESVDTLDSQETFGQDTIARNTGKDGSKEETKLVNAPTLAGGMQMFQEVLKSGTSKEEIVQKAQQYIKRKVTRDFQESTAAYQAVLDDFVAKFPTLQISQQDDESSKSKDSQITSNTFLEMNAPASGDNAGQQE